MSVTVILGGDAADLTPALDTAIQLTKHLKTTLTGLCVLPDPANSFVYVAGAEAVMMGSAAIASLTEAQDKFAKELKAVFETQTQAAGAWLKASFVKEQGSIASRAAAANLLEDAFVVPKGATQSNHSLNPAFEHVLMEANLPLILAPRKATDTETCIIAWDGSPIAARAVRMHLPLITTYKKVVIAHHPEKVRHQWAHVCGASQARLKTFLQEERLEVVESELSGPVSEALLSTAEAHQASMIVMGAYGHARIGQMLFGGTTSALLHSDTAPALALCR
ncbi:MAG: universal stress protein [Pseudomonadota bacterium]